MNLAAAIEIGGRRIEIRTGDERLRELAVAFASYPSLRAEGSRPPDVQLLLSHAERMRWDPGPHPSGACPPEPLALWILLRSAIARALAPEGAVLHSAAAAIDGRALLFLAPPGGGKTTIIDLLEPDAELIGDELVAVTPDPARGGFRVQGTPCWSGRFREGAAGSFPVSAICFLRKGALDLAPLPRPAALRELLPQCYLTDRPRAAVETLDFATALLARTPAYALTFPLGASLAPWLRRRW